MTTFTVGQPIKTEKPQIAVDAGLKPGMHRFQLEVVDDTGNKSKPVTADVRISDPTRPP